MNKLNPALTFFAITLIIVSCSTSKQTGSIKNPISGTWQLQTISTEGISGTVKATLLSEADFNCFVGSTWNFNRSGNTGYYAISKNGAECAAVKRNISWDVIMDKGTPVTFQYKRLDAKSGDMDAPGAGFNFRILELSNRSMQLRTDTILGEKKAAFIYNFVKN